MLFVTISCYMSFSNRHTADKRFGNQLLICPIATQLCTFVIGLKPPLYLVHVETVHCLIFDISICYHAVYIIYIFFHQYMTRTWTRVRLFLVIVTFVKYICFSIILSVLSPLLLLIVSVSNKNSSAMLSSYLGCC